MGVGHFSRLYCHVSQGIASARAQSLALRAPSIPQFRKSGTPVWPGLTRATPPGTHHGGGQSRPRDQGRAAWDKKDGSSSQPVDSLARCVCVPPLSMLRLRPGYRTDTDGLKGHECTCVNTRQYATSDRARHPLSFTPGAVHVPPRARQCHPRQHTAALCNPTAAAAYKPAARDPPPHNAVLGTISETTKRSLYL